MLLRCHRRLEERLGDLVAAAGDWRRRLDPEALEAAREAHTFIERTALRHERDEEESLFARLPEESSPLLDTLSAEHREHERCMSRLSKLLEEPRPDGAALLRVAVDLERRYHEHIDREEEELIPLIDAELEAFERAEVFREMQARRGK